MIYSFGLAAFCVAWLLPGHFFPWTGFQQETAAAIGALLLALAVMVSTGARRLAVPGIAAAAMLLAVVPMLQWGFKQVSYLGDAAMSSLYLCAFALTVVAARALAQKFGDTFPAAFFGAILVGAIASTALGLAQWLQVAFDVPIEYMAAGGRVYANFTQPNHLASLLGMGMVAAIWLFETRRIGPLGIVVTLLYLGFGVVMTQSRTGWAFVAMMAIWWGWGRRNTVLRSAGVGVVTMVAAFIGMTKLWPLLNAHVDLPTATLLADRVTLAGARSLNWVALWDAAWRHPWLGWGWMRVGAAHQATALDHAASHEWVTYSHNVVLDLWIWNGVALGTVIALGAVVWIYQRCSACRDTTTWSTLAAGGVLLTHALLEFPHAYAFFLLPLAVFIGVVESRHDGAKLAVPNWAFGGACGAMAAMLVWVCIEYLAVEDAARRQRFKEARYVAKGDEPTLPDVILLDHQREFLWFRMTEARPGMSKEELQRMRMVKERFMPPAVLLRYALATGLNGEAAQAERSLRLICHMWPARSCDEGRTSWASIQTKYPAVRVIAFPVSEP